MRLTKNTRLGKKPYKANNGYQMYNTGAFDPTKQISLNEQEFGVTPDSVQTSTGVSPQVGQSPIKLEGVKPTPDLSGQKIDFNKSSNLASNTPSASGYGSLINSGAAVGVGAIEKRQAELAANNKAPSLSGEVGKGALKGGAMGAQIDIMTGGATMGLGAATGATIGSIAGYVTGKKNIDRFNSEKRQKDSLLNLERQRVITQASQYNQLDATNRGYSAQGSNMSSFYGKNGGIIRKNGGYLKDVSSDTKAIYGQTHEQSNGSNNGVVLSKGVEAEGGGVDKDGNAKLGELMVDKGDHQLIVSDNIVNPKTGNTIAKDDIKLAKLQAKYEKSPSPLAKNSLKVIQAKREELHDLQQQMNGDASDMDTAQNGGKVRPINILTKPIKTSVPVNPRPMLAQNGGKLRPINILTKPVKTTPRPSTHLAENGMKLYGNGGGVYPNYGINTKQKPFRVAPSRTKISQEKAIKDDTFAQRRGNKDNIVKIKTKSKPEDDQPSTLKGGNLRKVWDKTKEVGQSVLPGLSRVGKLAGYMAPGVLDFMNHEANRKSQEKIPVPKMQNQGFADYAKQSAEPMIAAVKKQQADYNAGINGSLADSQTAALMKANMAAKAGDSIADIKMKVGNINSEIANKQTDTNLGIQKANYGNDYDYEANVVAKKVGIGNYGAENKSRLLENIRAVQNTNREERHTDMDTAIKMAGLEDRGHEYLRKLGASPEGFYTGKGLYGKNGGRLSKLTKLRR